MNDNFQTVLDKLYDKTLDIAKVAGDTSKTVERVTECLTLISKLGNITRKPFIVKDNERAYFLTHTKGALGGLELVERIGGRNGKIHYCPYPVFQAVIVVASRSASVFRIGRFYDRVRDAYSRAREPSIRVALRLLEAYDLLERKGNVYHLSKAGKEFENEAEVLFNSLTPYMSYVHGS